MFLSALVYAKGTGNLLCCAPLWKNRAICQPGQDTEVRMCKDEEGVQGGGRRVGRRG